MQYIEVVQYRAQSAVECSDGTFQPQDRAGKYQRPLWLASSVSHDHANNRKKKAPVAEQHS